MNQSDILNTATTEANLNESSQLQTNKKSKKNNSKQQNNKQKHKKPCKCGSTDHQRTKHTKCPIGIENRKKRDQFLNSQPERIPERIPKNAGPLYCKAFLDVDEYDSVVEDYIGKFEHICPHCSSINFADEKVGGAYSLCCHKGKVKLPKFKGPDKNLKRLFLDKNNDLSKNFRENIRNYNSACGFASMLTTIDPLTEKSGTMLFKVNGEVSHCVAKSLIPNQKKPSYGQLWVLDSETANEIRLQHPANTKCLPEVI
jgi:hypothetical protein